MKGKKPLSEGARMGSEEDGLGSYTGIFIGNKYEKPVQDADDL